MADPDQRFQMKQGQLLTRGLGDDPKKFAALGDDQQRKVLTFLNQFGNGMLGNGMTGNAFKNKILDERMGMYGSAGTYAPGQEDELKGLQAKLVELAGKAGEANTKLEGVLTNANTDLASKLVAVQETFFARLLTNRTEEDLRGKKVQLASA